MAQLGVNDVTYAFVASNIARQATTATDLASTTYIKEGEVVLRDLSGKVVTTTAASYAKDEMEIAFLKDTGLFTSPRIKAKNVTGYKVSSYSAPVNKIIYIGYNGTAGQLEANTFIPGNDYLINVRKLTVIENSNNECTFHKSFGYYNSTAIAGEAAVARGIVKNGIANFDNKFGADNFIKIEMVANTAATITAQNISFVENSKLAIGVTGHGVVAGDYLRVGGTGTTNPVYYVESVSTNNITLEVPYQETSFTGKPYILTAGNIATSCFGIKLTGTTKKFDKNNLKFRFDMSDFDVLLRYFSNTPVTYAQSANIGIGDWREVTQLEWEVQDMEGQTSHTDYLMPDRTRYAVENLCYDILTLTGYLEDKGGVTAAPKSRFTVIVAIPTTSTQGNAAGSSTVTPGLATALDLWLTANTGTTYNEDANMTYGT